MCFLSEPSFGLFSSKIDEIWELQHLRGIAKCNSRTLSLQLLDLHMSLLDWGKKSWYFFICPPLDGENISEKILSKVGKKGTYTEWAGKPQPKAIRFLLLLLLYGSILWCATHVGLVASNLLVAEYQLMGVVKKGRGAGILLLTT